MARDKNKKDKEAAPTAWPKERAADSSPTTNGYEKYITYDQKEGDELSRQANAQGGMKEPNVKHLGLRQLPDGRVERSFLKKIVHSSTILVLLLLFLFPSQAFSARSDKTEDTYSSRLMTVDLTELFAMTMSGETIYRTSQIGPNTTLEQITLTTGDVYLISGDNVNALIATIDAVSTWTGRTVTFGRPYGTPNWVRLVDADGSLAGVNSLDGMPSGNLILNGNADLRSGDTITLKCFDDRNWFETNRSLNSQT